jgi:hypothetical protein
LLHTPSGLYFDVATRTLRIADTGNHAIRAIDLSGDAATAIVTTPFGTPGRLGFFGDDLSADQALLYAPRAITRCGNGDFFIADTGNNRIRRVHLAADGTHVISTVLGDGTEASSGEGEPARSFPVDAPLGVACDAAGNVYATSSNTVRQLPADQIGVVDGSGPVFTVYGAAPRDTYPAVISNCLSGLAVIDGATLRVTDACEGLLVELTRRTLP